MRFLLALIFVCWVALSSCQAAQHTSELNKDFKQKKIFEPEIAAEEGSAPWQVSLQEENGKHICGGAIIRDNIVLTAASCVADLDEREVRVITGLNPAVAYEVQEIIIHCNYDRSLHHNDVALVKLATSISYDEKTHIITLANLDELEEGEILTVTEWGGGPEPGKSFSKQLKRFEFKYTSNEDCIQTLGQYGPDVQLGHLCALKEKGSGDCHADTGTPLVDSKGQLVGIGNWGLPCGHGYPNVFARVSFYSDWIRTSIKGCSLI